MIVSLQKRYFSKYRKFLFFALLFLLLTLLTLLTTAGISAQEAKAAIGIGPEWNMNSRDNFAAGTALSFDSRLPHSFALGLNAGASTNFSGITVIEPAALLRRYFSTSGDSGLFIQAEAGASLIFEGGEITPLFAGGLRGGFRLPLKASFYIEPYGRIGYPFVFGIGMAVGIRFINNGDMVFRR
jgi:hypothetical protein